MGYFRGMPSFEEQRQMSGREFVRFWFRYYFPLVAIGSTVSAIVVTLAVRAFLF